METSSFSFSLSDMRKFVGTLTLVLVVMMFVGCLMVTGGLMENFGPIDDRPSESAILHMRLEGIILDPREFLKDLRKYSKEEEIKGILLQVNSPGGVVGPSQEIYYELLRVKEELQKPIVVSVSGLAASGAYYAAAAANQIFTNPGSLIGSIGVIMEFANLEKLYEWAKIKRFVVKTGRYKDSGAEYRPMREDEKKLFQDMANEVLEQFKNAIASGRQMKLEEVGRFADGRVFTGAKAVDIGFADKIGTFEDARRAVGQLAGLGDDPELFVPPEKRPSFREFLLESRKSLSIEIPSAQLLRSKLWGQPLYILPSAIPVVSD